MNQEHRTLLKTIDSHETKICSESFELDFSKQKKIREWKKKTAVILKWNLFMSRTVCGKFSIQSNFNFIFTFNKSIIIRISKLDWSIFHKQTKGLNSRKIECNHRAFDIFCF